MTEEKINAFRQTDANLRNALEMDEAERPQMPADLNERLMQRMAKEDKQPRRIVWPWIAAACVAGIMVIWLMPPRATTTDVVAENTVIEQPANINKVEENSVAKVETETPAPVATPVKAKGTKVKNTVVKRDAALLAQDAKTAQTPTAETKTLPAVEEVNKELAKGDYDSIVDRIDQDRTNIADVGRELYPDHTDEGAQSQLRKVLNHERPLTRPIARKIVNMIASGKIAVK
jgi:hypothetical protein